MLTMSHAEIFDMPVEFGLELMAMVGSYGVNPERKTFDDVVEKGDCMGLCAFPRSAEHGPAWHHPWRCIENDGRFCLPA